MRLLLVGDLHLRAKKLKDVAGAWDSAIRWAHGNGVDLIVQAGDVFDHVNVFGREASTGSIFNCFLAPFEQDNPTPIFVIPGNHDIGQPKDKDALSPIDKYPWISVIRKPSVTQINDQLSICAVPWLNRVHLISKLLSGGMKLEEATQKVNAAISGLMTPLAAQVRKHKDEGRFVLFVGHLEISGAKLQGSQQQHGGSFEFTANELSGVGADAYALAHIHTRQHIEGLPNANDGYLGCICQLSFGEEGNEVGCRLLEIEGGKLTRDRWLDNKSSPRYFTVDSLQGLDFRPGIDYVKLRGMTRPESMPEGIIFERLPQAALTRLRTDDKLSCDLPLRTLLSAWKAVSNCPVDLDLLVAEAEALRSQTQVQEEAIGSLERIQCIRLKNLTCHQNTEIKLDVSGICGLAGPNGSGKTTAIEAIMLAIYGISPSRPAIQTMIPKGNGESVDSAVEVQFMSGGKSYIARREFVKTKKAFSQKVYFFEHGKDDSVASGVDGAYSFAVSKVGDPDLVLAGIFSSQGDSGNLVKQRPANRKDLFAKLLGTEKFIALSKLADKLATADATAIETKNARLETLKLELADEDKDVKMVASLDKGIASRKTDIDEVQKSIDEVGAAVTSAKLHKQERDSLFRAITDLEKKKEKIISDAQILKEQKRDLSALNAEEVEAALALARKARDEAEDVALKIADASTAQLAFVKARSALLQQREEEFKVIDEKFSALKNKADAVTERLGEAKRRSGLLQGFPDLPECKTCPLAKDIIVSRDSIEELQKELDALSARLTRGAAVLKLHKDETAEQVQSYNGSFVDHLPALMLRRNQLLKEDADVGGLEAKQAKVQSAKTELARINGLIESARGQFKEIDAEILKAKAELDGSVENDAKVLADSAILQARLKELNAELSAANVELGMYRAKLDQHAARKKEAKTLLADVKQKQDAAQVYEALAKAFCRDGIPQLIVDSAIPHLQEIMHSMMSEIDGKWTIRIATQKETQKGTTQERIEILVDDGEDERDISTYSGGEMNLLSTIVRVAFSILQAERSGRGLKVLVLDEAMYFADNEYSDAFMRMLRKLAKYFNQIFVISHSEFVLSSIQDKIFFARTSSGKTTVQADFGGKS